VEEFIKCEEYGMETMQNYNDLLFSDLTLEMTSYSYQTYPHTSYIHTHTRLQNKII